MESSAITTKKGITLTPTLVFLHIVGTICLAGTVGIIVFYVHPARRYSNSIEACKCKTPVECMDNICNVTWNMCVDLASKNNQREFY